MHKLIICAYDYEACDGLKLIEELSKLYANAKLSQKPNVVICSEYQLETFKSLAVNKGAAGFLDLPL